jgi:tetratricopeptide (TPR) repeat protein
VVLSKTWKLALTFVAAIALVSAQDAPKPAADAKPQKVAKDQDEANLINSIPKTNDPAERIKILDKWTREYPETAFAAERQAEYLKDYGDAKDFKNHMRIAAEMLKTDPNNETALRTLIGDIYQLKGAGPSDYDLADHAATYLIANADAVYADDKKPTGATSAQWAQLKGTMVMAAKNTIPYIDMQKKDDAKAESDLTKLLQSDPNDAQASYWLAQTLFGQREAKPMDQPPAIFEYARAGLVDGPTALPPALKTDANARATRYYKAYHGSDEGWDKVVALAKTNALPPPDFHIDSTADLEIARIKAQEAADAADPIAATWRQIKEGLTGPNAAAIGESLKGSGLPSNDGSKRFKGILVSQKPALNPKELIINYRDPVGDIKLVFATPLRGKMDPGAELEFWGTVKDFQTTPNFQITIEIADNKTDITGWKPLPVAAPGRGRATPKKQP